MRAFDAVTQCACRLLAARASCHPGADAAPRSDGAQMAANRILVLSLDGGTWRVLRPMAQSGLMPFVRTVIREGCCSELRSTVPPVTAPAWQSYLTAAFPSRHQTYDFQAFDREERRLKFLPDTCALPTGWDHLEALGEPYCCVGVPMTYPPRERSHGVVVSGIDSPGVDAAFPSREIRELAPPGYELTVQVSTHRSDEGFLRHAARVEECRGALTAELAARRPWRILHHHVQTTDAVQHRLWHRIEGCLAHGDRSVEEFYRRIDGVLQRLYERCEPDACVLLSDHGFGGLRKVITLNRWLLGRGYLRRTRRFRPLAALLLLARKLDVLNLRSWLLGRRRLWGLFLASAHLDGFDIDQSVAFVANGCAFGHLFVCHGAVQARVCELLRELRALRDPEDGTAVIERIISHQDAYGTPPGRYGPDYFLVPARGYQFCDAALFPRWARPIAPGDRRFGTGWHEMDGIFAVLGGRGVELVRAPCIVDVFPTVLHLGAIAPMAGVDGESCIRVEGRAAPEASSRAGSHQTEAPRQRRDYSAREARKTAGRLKGLGYF